MDMDHLSGPPDMKIGRQNCAIPHQIQPTSTTVAGANNSNTVTNPNPITVMHTVSHTDTKLTENVCVEDKHGVPDDSHRVTTLIPVSAPDVLSQSYGVECAPIAGIGLDEAPGMAMLSAESVMVDHQDVLQLHIEHDFAADDTGAQVILVYQDIFTCGACSKQFVDLSDFLKHKTKHTIAESLYKCELCKMVLSQQDVLIDHYQKIHQCSMYLSEEDDKQDAGNEADPSQTVASEDLTSDVDEINLERKSAGMASMDASTIDNIMNGTITVDGVAFVNSALATNEAVVHTGLSVEPESGDVELHTPSVQPCLQAAGHALPTADLQAQSLVDSTGSENTIALLQPQAGVMETSLTMPTPTSSFGRPLRSVINTDILTENGNSLVKTTAPLQNGVVNGTNGEGVDAPSSDGINKTDFNFILQTEMIRGSSYTYGKTWFKCLHCDFKTHGKVAMTKHMHDRHDDLLDLHQSLDVKDVTANDKRKVMKMSTYESIFGRESRFRRRTKKGKRVEKQDIQGIFPCATCGKVFTRLRYLRKHSETHRTEKKYLCDECGKSFKSRTYLSVHRRVHKEKLFHCNQCDFTSKINAAIHAHRQVHNQGSVLCDICGNAYTDRSTLSKHKRVHDLNRPYTCNYPGCTWRFKTEVMCKAHIRAHTTEGKFKCSFCGYLFRHKHHLQRHESSMHGVLHTKTRTNQVGTNSNKHRTEILDTDIGEAVSLVINAETSDRLQLHGNLTQQHLVVATDNQGTPIAFEGGDLSSLNVAYQTLLQSQPGGDTHTLIMTQPEAHVVFQQE